MKFLARVLSRDPLIDWCLWVASAAVAGGLGRALDYWLEFVIFYLLLVWLAHAAVFRRSIVPNNRVFIVWPLISLVGGLLFIVPGAYWLMAFHGHPERVTLELAMTVGATGFLAGLFLGYVQWGYLLEYGVSKIWIVTTAAAAFFGGSWLTIIAAYESGYSVPGTNAAFWTLVLRPYIHVFVHAASVFAFVQGTAFLIQKYLDRRRGRLPGPPQAPA